MGCRKTVKHACKRTHMNALDSLFKCPPHCFRPHRSVSERVAFWLKPCMDNGLGRRRTDSETAAQVTGRGGGWLINPGVCRHAVTLPTGCSWIKEHLDPHTPPHPQSMVHPWLAQQSHPVWCSRLPQQMVNCVGTGRALDERGWCLWVIEAYKHALASTGHSGHIYLVRELNSGHMVVHFRQTEQRKIE